MAQYDERDLQSTLTYMKEMYGISIFLRNGKGAAYFGDLAPSLKNEKKMVEKLINLGIAEDFIRNAKETETTKAGVYKKAEMTLVNAEFIQPEAADKYLSVLAFVCDWKSDTSLFSSTKQDQKSNSPQPSSAPIQKQVIIQPATTLTNTQVQQVQTIPTPQTAAKKKWIIPAVFAGAAALGCCWFLFKPGVPEEKVADTVSLQQKLKTSYPLRNETIQGLPHQRMSGPLATWSVVNYINGETLELDKLAIDLKTDANIGTYSENIANYLTNRGIPYTNVIVGLDNLSQNDTRLLEERIRFNIDNNKPVLISIDERAAFGDGYEGWVVAVTGYTEDSDGNIIRYSLAESNRDLYNPVEISSDTVYKAMEARGFFNYIY